MHLLQANLMKWSSFREGICPVLFAVWGSSALSPFTFVCKSLRLLVHGRLVNTLLRISSGSLTSGKTFALKYCLSSSSMSAPGLQDNICSPHVPKTRQPACSLYASWSHKRRIITRLLSPSQLLSLGNRWSQFTAAVVALKALRQTRSSLPPPPVAEMTKSLIGVA